MSDILWMESYSVGVPSIDDQHKQLIELNNQLFHAIMEDRGRDVVLDVLGELAEYATRHFSHEEDLLNEYGFDPALLSEHVAEHRSLTEQVQDYLQGADQQSSLDLVVYDFLRDWTTNHLKETDSKYANFLQRHGVR